MVRAHWIVPFVGCGSLALATGVIAFALRAQTEPEAIDGYIRPYVQTNNFAGTVLVERHGTVLFERSYGLADREDDVPNTSATCYHVASVSMQFTAAAILRLADARALRLEQSVGTLLPGTEGADRITIDDLLTERSGLADINNLPDYDEILRHHQTPATLVREVSGRALLAPPGSPSLHEEHSAYNLLALVVERTTRHTFAASVRHLVFEPLHLDRSFVDDDSDPGEDHIARGYAPSGIEGLVPADPIHWSAKAGNASVCTTVHDEARWIESLFSGRFLSPSSTRAVLDTVPTAGYGWFRSESKEFGLMYHMTGRSPGFASFVLRLPDSGTTVILFSNIYSSAPITMGYDIARIVRDLPHGSFQPAQRLSPDVLRSVAGRFQFGPTFYQKNAILEMVPSDSGLSLRWPGGRLTELIPVGADKFIDRSYWEPVSIERDGRGRPVAVTYDTFRGTRVTSTDAPTPPRPPAND